MGPVIVLMKTLFRQSKEEKLSDRLSDSLYIKSEVCNTFISVTLSILRFLKN